MTLAEDLVSPASSVTQTASAPFPSCRTSRHASAFYTWGGHSFSKWQKLIPLSCSIVDLFRTRARASTTTSPSKKSQITIFLTRGPPSRSAANSGTAYSDFHTPDSLRDGSSLWSAATQASTIPILVLFSCSPSLASTVSSVSSLLDLWRRRHLTRGVLREYVDDCSVESLRSTLAMFLLFLAACLRLFSWPRCRGFSRNCYRIANGRH